MRPLAAALLIVALAGAARVWPVQGLAHDGAIGMLAASGRQAAYYDAMPTARWTTAATWQDRWRPRPDEALRLATLRQIGAGLGHHDIHPPLYFWTLHAWLSATGHTPRAAAVLGLLTLLVAVGLVAGLARHAGADGATAAAVAALWGLTGAALDAVLEPRPYVAVAGLSAGLVWLMLRYRDRPAPGRLLAVGGVGLAALLTHYYLALVGAAAGMWVGTVLARTRPRPAAWLVGAGLAAAGAAALLHPYLLHALTRTGSGAPGGADLIQRLALVAASPVRMALPVGPEVAPPTRALLVACAVAGAAGVLWCAHRWRRRSHPRPAPLVIGACTLAAVAVLFVTGVAPLHSMDPRYGLLVSPLLVAGAARYVPTRRRALVWSAVAAYAVMAFLAPLRPVDLLRPFPDETPVVVDASSAGFVIPLVRRLPPATPVWVGSVLPRQAPSDSMVVVFVGGAVRDIPGAWRAAGRRSAVDGTARLYIREGSGNP